MPRKEIPSWLFNAVLVVEIYTFTVIVAKTAFEDPKDYEWLSCLSGPPRYAISIMAAYALAGRDVWRYWLIVDNYFYLGLLSIATYYFLLLGKGITSALTFCAWLNYVFLCIFSAGHFRLFMIKMKWTGTKVFIYKLVKIYGVLVYIALGSWNTLDDSLANRDLYLLFVFTTAAYYSEYINGMTAVDGTEDGRWDYCIEDEDEKKGKKSPSLEMTSKL